MTADKKRKTLWEKVGTEPPAPKQPKKPAQPKMPKSSVSAKLKQALKPKTAATPPHLIVEARAGTGKTTTLIEGLKLLRGETPRIEPSPQQRAVWDEMVKSKDAQTIAFVAFNRSIAEELKRRVPAGVDAMTMNSLGGKAVFRAFGRQEPTNFAEHNRLAEVLGQDSRVLQRTRPALVSAVVELVALCKQNLVGVCPEDPHPDDCVWDDDLDRLAAHYDVQIEDKDRVEVYQLVPKVIEASKEPTGTITFADQIWLPIVLGLPVYQYDLLLVDEAQDLNRCQQALAKKAGRRLILVGDPKQAIYGFAGADSESMKRMEHELSGMYYCSQADDGGHEHVFTDGKHCDFCSVRREDLGGSRCIILPLTVTRRCGKAIVEEARKIVPDFEAHPENPPGKISYATMED